MAYTTIKKPSDYFNTLTYTGDGSSSRNITGVGFQPDLLWIKNRDATQYHFVFDAVRGVSKAIFPNATDAESTQIPCMSAFLSDGFTVGSDAASNGNGNGIVAWNWLANGAGSANTDGDINSTVSVNQTAGFSIVKYTGTDVAGDTVGHGLGAVPKMIILKRLVGSGYDWVVYHKDKTAGLYLNSTGNNNDSSSNNIWFNGTAPTSSVFSIGTDGRIGDATDFIAYCFADVQGFSKFGSYTGNGSTDGPFIYTGFKPAFVLLKRTDSAGSYYIYDNKRDSFNVMTKNLFPNLTDVEDDNSNNNTDFLSNGFKIRTVSGARNASGGSYIYMAFAEEPLVGDNPATAR
jgi:hypothetical protein